MGLEGPVYPSVVPIGWKLLSSLMVPAGLGAGVTAEVGVGPRKLSLFHRGGLGEHPAEDRRVRDRVDGPLRPTQSQVQILPSAP
jgi:hypothetical protein